MEKAGEQSWKLPQQNSKCECIAPTIDSNAVAGTLYACSYYHNSVASFFKPMQCSQYHFKFYNVFYVHKNLFASSEFCVVIVMCITVSCLYKYISA